MKPCWAVFAFTIPSLLTAAAYSQSVDARRNTSLALRYLTAEVPKWSRENHCYSCHNNGDAARALFYAYQLRRLESDKSLRDSVLWLQQPSKWKDNGSEVEFRDQRLAAIQFSSAMVDAREAGLLSNEMALSQAGELVAREQNPDGSWMINAVGSLGSPTTYGTTLATRTARRILVAADPVRWRRKIEKSETWLRSQSPVNVLGAAAQLWALHDMQVAPDSAAVTHCLELIRKGEAPQGGWGPYINSAPEAFDTALVLLALNAWRDSIDVSDHLRNGRRYLMTTQLDDGSWQETTRPANGDSYAQRLSTAGWATLALMATDRSEEE